MLTYNNPDVFGFLYTVLCEVAVMLKQIYLFINLNLFLFLRLINYKDIKTYKDLKSININAAL